MLKYTMQSLDGIEASIAALYTKQADGTFILTGVEGITSKSKVDEFRNNNIALTNQLAAFKDIDPARYQQMAREIEEYKIRLEKAGMDEEQVKKLVDARVVNMKTDYEKQINTLTENNTTMSKQLEVLIIDNAVSAAARENKVTDSAVTDVILRAKNVFKVENGKPVAYDNNGQRIFGNDGTSDLSISDWVKGLVKTSPHLFEPSVTGGLRDHKGRITGDVSKLSPLGKIQAGLG